MLYVIAFLRSFLLRLGLEKLRKLLGKTAMRQFSEQVNKIGKIQRCDFAIFESRTRPFFEKWDCPFIKGM